MRIRGIAATNRVSGWTLVEVLFVIALLAMMAFMLLPGSFRLNIMGACELLA